MTTSNPSGTTVYKLGGAPTYIFHNSVDSSLAAPRWDTYVSATPLTVLNNIAKSSGSMIDYAPAASLFDYNLSVVTGAASFAYKWNGVTTYDSFPDFQLGTGQESHGIQADPLFIDNSLRVGATSPAVDKGVIIMNFNSLDSAWPYSGSAPDIGAFELGAGSYLAAPSNLAIH